MSAAVVPTGPTEDRNTYLGASDMAAVAGVHPYATALDVFASKTGLVPPIPDNPRMRVGRKLERPVVEL